MPKTIAQNKTGKRRSDSKGITPGNQSSNSDQSASPVSLREIIQGYIDQSRDQNRYSNEEAIAPAQEAMNLSLSFGETDLIIDAVLNLLNRLQRANRNDARDRLIEEWRGKIILEGNGTQRAYLANTLAIVHLHRGEYGDALAELRLALLDTSVIADPKLVAMIQINAGNAYSGLGIYDMAMSWFHKALKNADALNDNPLRSYIHNNLGILHRKLSDFERAAIEFELVVELTEQTGDMLTRANVYTNLCTVHFNRKEWDKSMDYSRRALEINQSIGNQYGILACLTNIGMVYKELDEYEMAMEKFEAALSIATSLDGKHQIANLLMNVANLHIELDTLSHAQPLLDKAKRIAEEIGAQDLLNDIYMAYTSLYEKAEDYPRAVDAYKQLVNIRSEVFQGKQRDVIEELQIRYQVENKEREAEAYRQKNDALENEIKIRMEVERELKEALASIKVLTGLLPVCADCRKVRDEDGQWHQMEHYISNHSDAQFSHGYCPTCAAKALSDLRIDMK